MTRIAVKVSSSKPKEGQIIQYTDGRWVARTLEQALEDYDFPTGNGGYDGDPDTIEQDPNHRFHTDEQATAWDSKAAGNHNHDVAYSAIGHNHDYAASNHNHDAAYAGINHNHNAAYSAIGHNHNGDYSAIGHTHNYEPANANIQSHIGSAHAPSNAQKNSDITKAEIEAKLTGLIPSHTHYIASMILASNVSTGANVTPVNLTGMSFTYVAGGIYRIDIYATVQAPAATTGHGFGVNCTTAPVLVSLGGGHILANTGTGSNWSAIANNAIAGVSSGVPANATNVQSIGGGVLVANASTGGTCQFIFRSETTAVTTCMANTVIMVTKVN
jgi:hypothetical protein